MAEFGKWWLDRKLGVKIAAVLVILILALGFMAHAGWVVMLLGNWIVPDTIGWKPITFWKAFGLFALCSILFNRGAGRSGGGKRPDRNREETRSGDGGAMAAGNRRGAE